MNSSQRIEGIETILRGLQSVAEERFSKATAIFPVIEIASYEESVPGSREEQRNVYDVLTSLRDIIADYEPQSDRYIMTWTGFQQLKNWRQ